MAVIMRIPHPMGPGARQTRGEGLQVVADVPDHWSPVDFSIVKGRAGRREHNKRNGCIDVGNDRRLRPDYVPPEPKLPSAEPIIRRLLQENGYG